MSGVRPRLVLVFALMVCASLIVPCRAGAATDGHSGDVWSDTKGLTRSQVTTLEDGLVAAWGGLPGGVSAGLWVGNKGYWVGAVGDADIKTGAPMRPELQLPIGSVTKTLTGTLVLQQVQRGRLRLTDPMSKWFPTFPKAEQITVSMLLNMSSGIADYVNGNFARLTAQQRAHPKRRVSPGTMIWGAARMPRAFDLPGSQFAYSNTNTIILGRILEKSAGKSYNRLLKKRILEPLGMYRSFLDMSGDLWPRHAQTYSMLYGQVHGSPPLLRTTNWSLSTGWSAGGLASTVADLRTWAKSLGTGNQVLHRATQRTRTGDCVFNGTNGTLEQDYCLGVAVLREVSTGDVVSYWHNGTMLGATSYVAYYPRTKAILVVQSNQDAQTGDAGLTIPDKFFGQVLQGVPELLGL